jgi:hypothetical protein
MKQLFSFFAIVLTVSFFSCQNKKTQLVDLDRRYRDSSRKYFDLAKMCLDDDFNSHPHKTELERLRTHDTSEAISKKAMDRYKDLIRKCSEFKVMADSVESELKKY